MSLRTAAQTGCTTAEPICAGTRYDAHEAGLRLAQQTGKPNTEHNRQADDLSRHIEIVDGGGLDHSARLAGCPERRKKGSLTRPVRLKIWPPVSYHLTKDDPVEGYVGCLVVVSTYDP